MRSERRAVISVVTQEINAHAPQIEKILVAMHDSNATVVKDTAFQEMQTKPSSSLISRSMIRIESAGDGHLECVIDTSALGVPPRTIRSSH